MLSCKNDTSKKVVETTAQEIKKTVDPKQSAKSANEVPINLNQSFIKAFTEYIENFHCTGNYSEQDECYGMHDTAVKTDYLQGIPMAINFPYNGSFDWGPLKAHPDFSDYWSEKCGFAIEQEIVNYICPNIEGETRVWLDSLAKTNELVDIFKTDYYETIEIDQTQQQQFFLSAKEKLDFTNLDHRAFYWTFHLTLAELSDAIKKITAIQKNASTQE